MTTIRSICDFLEDFAPSELAEDWDNIGLLVGDETRPLKKILTCLTVTPQSAREAIEEQADLIVAHHPLPFRALKRITAGDIPGKMLLDLIAAGVAIYSPHTAFDSAAGGINQQWATGLGLKQIAPLNPMEADPAVGSGRYGDLDAPAKLSELASRVGELLGIAGMHIVGKESAPISRVAVACGSAGQFLASARRAGCDCLITGETNFHTCLEAEATGVSLLLPGHYASERFAVETLARVLSAKFPELSVWASRNEADPLKWFSG